MQSSPSQTTIEWIKLVRETDIESIPDQTQILR